MDYICAECGKVLTKTDIDYNKDSQTPFFMCVECTDEWLDNEGAWDDGYDEDRDLLGY